jgi:site-specific recombinase XerD
MAQAIKFITQEEFKIVSAGAKKTQYPIRNQLILLMLYRHGLRETELCHLRVDQLDLEQAKLHIKRIKGGNSFTHPIAGDELRLIRRYIRHKVGKQGSHLPWLFISSRGNQISRTAVFNTVRNCAIEGGITQKTISPHMLRHGCGYYLANKGVDVRVIQDYLGHKNIQNTVIYTQLTGKKFEGLWD